MKIERRAERALADSRGRGIPRASAFMRLFCQPASTRTEERGRYRSTRMRFIFIWIYQDILSPFIVEYKLVCILISTIDFSYPDKLHMYPHNYLADILGKYSLS